MNYLKLIGALTSKPYAFTARSWELKNIETIDLFDALGSNVRIDIRGSEIMRVLPLTNEFINEEWISDKARFSYDGLKRWRFIYPLVKKEDIFVQTSWTEVFKIIKDTLNNKKFSKIVINTGNFTDLETLTALKKFTDLNNNVIVNNNITKNNINISKYTLDLKDFHNVEGQKVYILVGIILRLENPVLNIRLRRLSQQESVLVAYIGPKYDSNLNFLHLGNNLDVLKRIIEGKHHFVSILQAFLKKNNQNIKFKNIFKNKISVILNENIKFPEHINKKYFNGLDLDFKTLVNYSGKINALEIGFYTQKQNIVDNKPNLLYLVGIEDYKNIKENDFVIFQGDHNDKIRTKFNIILPTVNWTEKSSIYLNTFGIAQKTNFVVYPPVNARVDWKITRMLSLLFNKDISFNTVQEVHKRLNQLTPKITNSLNIFEKKVTYKLNLENKKAFNSIFKWNSTSLRTTIFNYYNLTSIERSSKIMQNCSENLKNTNNNFLK